MFATPEQFADVNKSNVEAVLTLANTAFAPCRAPCVPQSEYCPLDAGRWPVNAKALLAVKDVQELSSLQTPLTQPMIEKAVAYNRNV